MKLDVLGYIFEKFINQKDKGHIILKDITSILEDTIIPSLLIRQEKCSIAFEGDRNVWDLLKDDPDRYFYDSVKRGINHSGSELPMK